MKSKLLLLGPGLLLCSALWAQDTGIVALPVSTTSAAMAQTNIKEGTPHIYQNAGCNFQFTYIYQYKPAFHAAYSGTNSLISSEENQNSMTATMFLSHRLWHSAAFFFNPELAGGGGLSGAFGMGGSTNGEAFRVGDPSPSLYLARAYVRQTFILNRDANTGEYQYEKVESGINELSDNESPVDYLRIYAGKFSMGDFFDNNSYANSPRTQFINWSLMNNGAWDYSANLRGYTAGLVAVLKLGANSVKAAMAAEPKVANGPELNLNYGVARGLVAEVSRQISIEEKQGHISILGYRNQANMGSYQQAIDQAVINNSTPDIVATRQYGRTRTGVGMNVDQQLNDWLGAFARVGWSNGKTETWAFTEIDNTATVGVNLNGKKWHRCSDNAGVAFAANALSADHKAYLAAGGLGFQLGDGKLQYAPEMITEVYFSYHLLGRPVWLSADYQLAFHPGYNADRGPVNVFSIRAHAEI